jgi:hypothetical protein
VPMNHPSFMTTLLFVGVPLLFITKGRMAFVAAAMASACLMLYGQLSLTGDNMTVLLPPVVVWMGVLGTCGMVGASLGSARRHSIGVGVPSAVYFLFIVGPLFGYSAAAEFVLGRVADAGYSASALEAFAVFVLMSLGAEVVISSALKTQRVVLGGSLIGVATALCAIGPGIPLVIWLIPIFPSATSIASFVPTFAGALAAWRIAGDAFQKAGSNGPPLAITR